MKNIISIKTKKTFKVNLERKNIIEINKGVYLHLFIEREVYIPYSSVVEIWEKNLAVVQSTAEPISDERLEDLSLCWDRFHGFYFSEGDVKSIFKKELNSNRLLESWKEKV